MIEPPETPHHVVEHHRTNIKWFDVAMAVAVLVVSFGSLYVSLHTGHTMEALVEQNQRLVRAQSTPILQYTHGNDVDGQPVLHFQVRNVGTGPARLAWARLEHGGRTYATWSGFALAALPAVDRLPLQNAPLAPSVLSAGEERPIMRWPREGDADQLRAWDTLERSRFNAVATACYCSVFDECWTSHMNGDVPRQVESCENPRALSVSGKGGH
jgi:hypothetical protein